MLNVLIALALSLPLESAFALVTYPLEHRSGEHTYVVREEFLGYRPVDHVRIYRTEGGRNYGVLQLGLSLLKVLEGGESWRATFDVPPPSDHGAHPNTHIINALQKRMGHFRGVEIISQSVYEPFWNGMVQRYTITFTGRRVLRRYIEILPTLPGVGISHIPQAIPGESAPAVCELILIAAQRDREIAEINEENEWFQRSGGYGPMPESMRRRKEAEKRARLDLPVSSEPNYWEPLYY